MPSDVTALYLEHRQLIDKWAASAEHLLLRACARVVKKEALLELEEEDHESTTQ